METGGRCRRGFTLIELLVVIIVIAVGLMGIMALFENALRGAFHADLNLIAANLAREKLERIVMDKAISGYDSLDGLNYPDETFSGDLSVFSRDTLITEVSSADLETAQAGSGYKRIDVTVTWGAAASQRITIPTVLASY